MRKAQHTPGPWIYAPAGKVMQGYSQPFGISQSDKANLVAGVFGDVAGGEEAAKANALLIAAAPELLEALKVARVAVKCCLRHVKTALSATL